MNSLISSNNNPKIILCLDPGKKNFGWSIVAARSMTDYILLDSGMFYTVSSYEPIIDPSYLELYTDEIMSLAILGDVEYAVIERFHCRGQQIIQNQIEYINIMIGAAMISLQSLPWIKVIPVTASAWKRDMYSGKINDHKHWFPNAFNVHAGDAACMGLRALKKLNLIQ